MIAAGEMWDRRYTDHAWPSEPDPLLVAFAGDLPCGRGIDLASGPGRNSIWLAAKGWQMTLVDASRVALDQAVERGEAAAATLSTVQADVLTWTAPPSYDLAVVANLHPDRDSLATVLASAAEALVDGGHLFVVGHHVDSLGRHGPPDPERLLTVERLRQALPVTLAVQTLEDRIRDADHGGDAHAAGDRVVYAWATRLADSPRR
jgi:SAM-dependent methyltransferase